MKIAVGMSGGIDSSTTALLLKEAGHDVIGVTMFLFEHQTSEIEHAKLVCEKLGIPHHIMDYRAAFQSQVVSEFIRTYEAGHTPNPCIKCNRLFKYGQLIKDVKRLGAEAFSTGHYAKVHFNRNLEEYEIHMASNRRKDQSYNLFHLNQETLSMLRFPLGDMGSKDAVRALFQSVNVETAKKKDSLGICFIEHKQHELYLKSIDSSAMKPGNVVDKSGNFLGYHQGIAGYTVGQKKGLPERESGKYVTIGVDAVNNQVIVGDEADLIKYVIKSNDFNFISNHQKLPQTVSVKVSQWSTVYTGQLSSLSEEQIIIRFQEPVRAPALGQAVVCYEGTKLIGGGTIHEVDL